MKGASEERTRSVLDPIHGLIRLTETEMKVVAHPLFQRLRQIKQNGLLHLVFPGATHTRFEHSLGVLYVAHGMLNSLVLNSTVGRSKENVRRADEAESGQAAEFPPRESTDGVFIYRVTRLAALAHDLGHGPLSHTFDSFAPTRDLLKKLLDDDSVSALTPLRDFILNWGTDKTKDHKSTQNHRTPHEVMSCIFFARIWHTFDDEEPSIAAAVCAAILGRSGETIAASLLSDSLAQKWIPLVHDIVASAPADADRMDYMERDSKSIGVTYGLFDRNRVLKSLLCYREIDGDSHLRLGIKHSGLQAIENLMQARYELFVQVYYHKTNRALSRMLEAISGYAEESVDLFAATSTLDGLVDRYRELSDEAFFKLLLGKNTSWVPADDIREIAEAIQDRQLWKRILDPTTETEANAIWSQLQQDLPDDRDRIRVDNTRPRALKDLSKGAPLLVRGRGGIYEVREGDLWAEESTIIAALTKADDTFVRIYFDGTDAGAAKRIRDRALSIAFERTESTNAAS